MLELWRSFVVNLAQGETIKAFSFWEPWASLIARGAKTIETRTWSTNYRGPLLVCASKRFNAGEMALWLSDPAIRDGLDIGDSPLDRAHIVTELEFGNAVAIVELVDCLTTDQATKQLKDNDRDLLLGDFSPGRFAWVTKGLVRIEPFPITGKQGLFSVELPLIAEYNEPSIDERKHCRDDSIGMDCQGILRW